MWRPSGNWPAQSLSFGIFFFSYYSFVGVFPPYVTLFLANRGISAFEIGILMAIMQAMRIVGPNLWGWMADVFRRRSRVLQMTAAGAVVAFIGMFFGQTFVQFAVLMVLINLFTSAQGPLSEAIMLAEMRGDLSRYGPLRLWGSVGYIVMTVAAGYVLMMTGIEHMPWIGLLILGGVLAVSLRIYDTPQSYGMRQQASLYAVVRRPEVMAFLVSACFMLAAHSALYAYYSLYLAKLGYSNLMIGLMWALGATAEIIFFIYQAPIFRRFGIRNIMLFSLLCAVLRFFLIGAGAESLLILMLAQILHFATFGAHHSSSIMTIQRWFGGALQARGQALFISASYGIGGTVGALLLSVVWEQLGASIVYYVAAGFSVFAFVSAWLSFRWQQTSDTSATGE